MKRLAAGLATTALMGLLLWSGLRRPVAPPATAEGGGPFAGAEARVDGLLEAAQAGDVDAYLNAFTGPARERLERQVAGRGRAAFADELRRAAATRKGHAVFAPVPEGDEAVRITVEAVYADRNERQTYRLERAGGEWLIADLDVWRDHAPKARFGAPAQFDEAEGVPVSGD